MRIREKAHVEHQVGIAHRPVFEAKALERDGQPTAPRRQHLVGQLASQHRRSKPGGVDHHVGAPAHRRQQLALSLDALRDVAARRERMAPARLLVARQQRLLVGVEEQHPVRHPALA